MDTRKPPKPQSPPKRGFLRKIGNLFSSLNSGMNHDFCPNANKYVYWLKEPIGWIVSGAAFSALVGVFIGPQGFVLMWSFLALLAIGAVWPWLSMRGIGCKLSFDRSRIQENGLATAIVEVTNKWPIPVFGLMVQGEFLLDLIDEDDRVAMGLQRVPGLSVSKFSWSFEPKQRGILPFDEPILTNGFPFGLYQCQREIKVERQTIVWPADCGLKGAPGLDGTQFNIAGMMSERPGVDGDMIGIRQYRQGDSLKHVHWPKTAALGKLIVQERQTNAQRPFEVVIDLDPAHHRGQGSQSSYEWAIRIASSVCSQLHRHQAEVRLVCLGLTTEHKNQSANVSGLGQLLDYLATLPTLDTLREQIAESAIQKVGKSATGQIKRFFVCTDLSSHEFSSGEVQRIILESEFFDPNLESERESAGSDKQSGIKISSPGQAVDDLQNGWSRGVCYGS